MSRAYSPTTLAIREALAQGPMTAHQLRAETGLSRDAIAGTIANMTARGEVVNITPGVGRLGTYALNDGKHEIVEPATSRERKPGVHEIVRATLKRGAMTFRQIAAVTGLSPRQAQTACQNLVTRGELVNLNPVQRAPGLFALFDGPHHLAELPELEGAEVEDTDEPIRPSHLGRQSPAGLDLHRAWHGLPVA